MALSSCSRPRPTRLAAGAGYAARAGLVTSFVFGLVLGCGSRGPLDDAPSYVLDGGVEASASLEAGAAETGSKVRDSGFEAGTIAACGVCVIETCTPTIVQCIQTASCVSVLQCAATKCLGLGSLLAGSRGQSEGGAPTGGGLSLTCLLGCIGSDPQGVLDLLGVVKCVTGDCASDCGSLLGGLGNLGGLGGLGGGGGGHREATPEVEAEAFAQVFSPWPELMSH